MIAFIGFLAFCFVGLTIVNRIAEGLFVAEAELETVNQFLVFDQVSILNAFKLPVPNFSFITEGLPRLVAWDYSFFGGNAAIFTYFLYSISAALAFLLFTIMIGFLFQFFARSR